MSSHRFAGDILIRAGVVDAAGLSRGLDLQSRQGMTLGRALAGLGLADESAVAAATASAMHLEYLDGELPEVGAAVAGLLSPAFCLKRGAAPLGFNGKALRVAVTNPMDYSVLQDVEFRTSKRAVAVVVTQTWLEAMCRRLYPEADQLAPSDILDAMKPAGEVEAAAKDEFDVVDPVTLAKNLQLPPVVKLVNLILSDAAKAGASDVHIEPHETQLQVRQRVDGLLHDVMTVPRPLQDATISRFKIMSGMDIAERRKPQDGRSRLRYEGRRIDLRVSTMPTQFGEKIVIRLLNADKAIQPLDQLGLSPENLSLIQSFISNAQGMVLVTGPTGSGKTSTLYTVLNSIKSSSNNIITLEDPIEMQIPGVNQVLINAKAGVTFASGLRSILRQDPNVILVGEIRDQETANIALGAAQTGHLLLSTLHTNDATATITRLFDLGIQPFLIASSLLGIVAQRLVRRPCPGCTIPQPPSTETIEKLGGASQLPDDGQWVSGRGCPQCQQSGLKGRIAIHEVLAVTDEVRDLISNRAAEHVIKKAARRAGMRTLLEDGIDKAAQGLTTLDEVLRVVSSRGDATVRADTPPVTSAEADIPSMTAAAADIPPVTAAAADIPPVTAAEADIPPVTPAFAASPSLAAAAVADGLTAPDPASRRNRVLVVEDSPTIASVVKYFLELDGFEVSVAVDGLAGLATALKDLPDVIVSDVNMPGMGGVAMVKALRDDGRTAQIRIIMLTSEASIESETAGLAAGADDYILKPVEPRRLAARVKALLARSRPTAA